MTGGFFQINEETRKVALPGKYQYSPKFVQYEKYLKNNKNLQFTSQREVMFHPPTLQSKLYEVKTILIQNFERLA